jgi:hypothetical protein
MKVVVIDNGKEGIPAELGGYGAGASQVPNMVPKWVPNRVPNKVPNRVPIRVPNGLPSAGSLRRR